MKCHIQFPGKNQKKETVCMKCRIESSSKNKKNTTTMSSAKSAHRVVVSGKVKSSHHLCQCEHH